ncbi:2-hydroxychromene-2-carboxylate isomerase [Pararhodobacter sp. SW119]|uniref:2-hydroxychromene-2-carboxylate isomerase n=1 Tax=Pararhodobacter sp. SW119 TaxID=2780075 RepID=UPI001AE03761
MSQIDYFLTVTSPYVYFAGRTPAEIATRHGVPMVYRPVDPGAIFARTGGTPLAERHESRKTYRLQDLRRQAAKRNLPMTLQPRHFPTNPAPAGYAVIAAQEAAAAGQGGDIHALVQGLSRACWEEERDVADDAVIRDCLSASGFDPGLAMSGLLSGADTYDRNLVAAMEAGVFGFPFWVVGEERFWGQDRLEDLDRYLTESA